MRLITVLAIATLTLPCFSQTAGSAQVFPGTDVASQISALLPAAKATGSGGATLGDFKTHAIKLSVRMASGGAEVHAHYDDIFVVTRGKATLLTGGTVLNAKTGNDGETKGSGIQDGKSQTIVNGDIVHIPAGTPHQLLLAPGDVFGAIVIKIREG